jgi:hypothetical protein
VAILKLANAAWVLRVDVLIFVACAVTALRLQVTQQRVTAGADRPPDATEVIVEEGALATPGSRREIRAKPLPPGAIQVAAFAMGMLRSIVGFITFLVAFGFRNEHAPAWWYGVILACSIGGNLVGAAVAPWLRSRLREELILAGSTATVAAAGALALLFNSLHSRPAASLLAGVVGFSAGAAKLSFDALVQRHVPAASQGRAFGRFEAGFQLVWVLGGLAPVVIEMSLATGFVIVTVAATVATVVYVVGTRLARLGRLPPWWPGVHPPAARRGRGPGPAGPGGTPSPHGATVPFGVPRPAPEPATIPFGSAAPWSPPPDPSPREGSSQPPGDRPWLDPEPAAPVLGTYPPPISGPPPLGRSGRPIPPPLAGPPPLAAPLAPRPPRTPAPGDTSGDDPAE